MARMPRLVVPGYPHHVTQRGSRRQTTFFSVADYQMYINLFSKKKESCDVDVWAYCLMPNHIHMIVSPRKPDSLGKLFGSVHRIYARRVNEREGWSGHLWQERFRSFVMHGDHALAAIRYVELNPVRAGLCQHPQEWTWSSVHAHMGRKEDCLMTENPVTTNIKNWSDYLGVSDAEVDLEEIRKHTRTGRPFGDRKFIDELEQSAGRRLRKRKPGRQPRNK